MTEEDHKNIQLLIDTSKAFSRCTHQCVYIMDCIRHCLLYVSDNIKTWCDLSVRDIKDVRHTTLREFVPKKDRQMIGEIHSSFKRFLHKQPLEKRQDYTICYDFHITHKNKHRLVNHHLTPVMLTKEGHIWLTLCTFSFSSEDAPGHVVMKGPQPESCYRYSFESHQWTEQKAASLNETEREILILSAQGNTMADIANMLCKSVDAIKSSRRSMFVKLGVKNIAEALSYSINSKLL